tara:strand:+ start:1716 stop:1928 length:213 start_codon:yes stop_codon:yes gene_type:complete
VIGKVNVFGVQRVAVGDSFGVFDMFIAVHVTDTVTGEIINIKGLLTDILYIKTSTQGVVKTPMTVRFDVF